MKDLVKILDLYKLSKTAGTPLFGSTTDLSEYDFMEDYVTNFQKIDRKYVSEKASFAPVWNTNYEEDAAGVLATFQEDIDAFLTKYSENLTRLYALMTIEYNPLENYRMEEEGSDEHSGEDELTDNMAQRLDTTSNGQRQTTDVNGQRVLTDVNGQVQVTDVNGPRQETDTNGQVQVTDVMGAKQDTDAYGAKSATEGAQANTSESKVSAFNSSVYANRDYKADNIGQKTNTELARTDTHSSLGYTDTHTTAQVVNQRASIQATDTHTTAESTDTHTQSAVTDTHTQSAVTDTFTSGAHVDKHTNKYGKKIEHELRRFGNIGITTSQQMAQSEIELWGTFNFYSILFDMITRELCSLYDVGFSLF